MASSRTRQRQPAAPAAAETKAKLLSENFIRVWAPTLVAALFIITFNVQAFEIPSGSMEKTLLIGDHLLVDRVRFAPPSGYLHGIEPYRALEHGDIVVFMSPAQSGLHLVKRVIGLPGDRLKLVNGTVVRNGQPLNKPYVMRYPVDCPGAPLVDPARDNWPDGGFLEETTPQWAATQSQYIHNGEVTVPPGHYFMMGDNRLCSFDSRYWGFVPQANLIGRPSIIYWSYRSQESDYESTGISRVDDWISTLVHFPTRTRWERTLHIIR